MEKSFLNKLNRSPKVEAVLYGLIFVVMLVFNMLSPYIMDDYKYMFSFADDTRLESLSQLIPSLIGHASHMNGRLVAHGWVQLFALMPLWVFDIVNSLMFVLQMALLCRIARCGREKSNLMIPVIFCVLWLFEPVFAQANLWQDGACNYLWSIVFCLLFILPFTEDYLWEKDIKTPLAKVGFVLFSFLSGAFSETISAAVIFMAGLLILLMVFAEKRKLRIWWIAAVAVAFLGYVSIYLAPAQWVEKATEMHPRILLSNFVTVAGYFRSQFWVLVCAFVILLAMYVTRKENSSRTWMLACVFFAGALAAHFILILANYYTPRSSIGAFALLAAADLILLYAQLDDLKNRVSVASAIVILILAMIPEFFAGVLDISLTYIQLTKNEAYIYECKENGILDVQLPLIESSTKYSIANGRKYLDEDPSEWPNYSMADYYGVNSIGVSKD